MNWIIGCGITWTVLGFIAMVMLPAPRNKFEAVLQSILGGPIIWASIAVILWDKYFGEDEEI